MEAAIIGSSRIFFRFEPLTFSRVAGKVGDVFVRRNLAGGAVHELAIHVKRRLTDGEKMRTKTPNLVLAHVGENMLQAATWRDENVFFRGASL